MESRDKEGALPITSSEELIASAIAIASQGRKKRVAVAAAQDVDVISAVAQAFQDGFVDGVLVGDETRIRDLAATHNVDINGLEVVDRPHVTEAALTAVGMASEGKADVIMKGFLPTSALLRTVLDRRFNLKGKDTLSHCAVLDIPGYHKLLNLTDGGMVVKPDMTQKLNILENAILVGRALGLSPVKIAVSAAVDHPTQRVAHTLADVSEVAPQAMKRFEDIAIQAPMPFDLATSRDVAEAAGVDGPVAGDADIFLVDSIEECNITAKSLIQFAGAIFAGVIVGARVPVSLVSRTDTIMNKKASLAVACVLADYYQSHDVWAEGGTQ
jgi:phosphate butyryltransferase